MSATLDAPRRDLVGYARVSTRAQNDEGQLDALTGVGCHRIFTDKVTGKAASRPNWDACLDYLRPGDTLVITRLSRAARSLRNLIDVAAKLRADDINLWVLKNDIDTRTAAGRLLFHILGAVDEFQVDIISENTLEGLAAARARGRRGGRPRALSEDQVRTARQLRDGGEMTMAQIAAVVGCSPTTLYREIGGRAS